MKRIDKTLLLILFIFSIPLAMASGQEKKTEKKIKIVVDEGSGEKILLDTVLTGTSLFESIELKDGKVIYIGKPEMDYKFMTEGDKIIVSVAADEDGKKHKEKRIFIASSGDNMTEWIDEDGIIVKDGKIIKKEGGHTFSIIMETDEDDDTDVTKYIIAKDGVVVTVESDDEEKAKEIIKVIENKLGVESDEKGDNVVVKKESKKTEKK